MTARAELVAKRVVVCSAITNASGAAYCASKPGHLHPRQQTGTVQACAAFAGWRDLRGVPGQWHRRRLIATSFRGGPSLPTPFPDTSFRLAEPPPIATRWRPSIPKVERALVAGIATPSGLGKQQPGRRLSIK